MEVKDLIVYVPFAERLFRILKGDGLNLTSEDIEDGYVDYLYYDVYDIQELSDIEDGGLVLLEKEIHEEFNDLSELIIRVLNMGGIFGEYSGLSYQILSGKEYWTELIAAER